MIATTHYRPVKPCYFVLLFLALLTGVQAKGKSKYVLKVATLAPEQSAWVTTIRDISKEVMKQTNSEVRIKCYPGGVQGDELTVLRKIRIGQLHGAGFTGAGLSHICKDSQTLQLPFLFKSYAEIDHIFPQMSPHLESICETNGYKVLGWTEIGFSYLFSRDRVHDLNSLRDSKPWLIEDDIISTSLYDASDITAIPAQVSDVLTALRSGLIHTVFSPPIGMISLQWFSRINHYVDTKIAYSFGSLAIAGKQWKRLPPNYQKVVEDISKRKILDLNKTVRQQNQEALDVMQKKQIKAISLSDDGKREFEEISGVVTRKLAGKTISEKSIQLVQSYLAEYREKTTNNE